MARLADLLAVRGEYEDAISEMEKAPRKDFDPEVYENLQDELKSIRQQIEAKQRERSDAARTARPNGGDDDEQGFKSFGEQLKAIMRASAPGGHVDPRLIKSPTGMGETDPGAGGFLVQTDFASTLLTRAYDMGEILGEVTKIPIGPNFNGIKIPGIDETSRATGSRWGGVQAYWIGEGDSLTASRPKFRLIELNLKKLAVLWYITDEMLADSTALTAIANQAFAEEIVFMTEDAIWEGSGAGMPQGMLNAKATIQVAAEKGQASATILYQNLLKMWAQCWVRSRSRAAWYINQEVEPQLFQLSQTVGTGGVPVYPGIIHNLKDDFPLTIFGRPVIPVEYASQLGGVGDIVLADFSQYVLAHKDQVQQAMSIHVRFTNDETAFRLIYRADGQSIWQDQLTRFKGTTKVSPFVTLAAR